MLLRDLQLTNWTNVNGFRTAVERELNEMNDMNERTNGRTALHQLKVNWTSTDEPVNQLNER